MAHRLLFVGITNPPTFQLSDYKRFPHYKGLTTNRGKGQTNPPLPLGEGSGVRERTGPTCTEGCGGWNARAHCTSRRRAKACFPSPQAPHAGGRGEKCTPPIQLVFSPRHACAHGSALSSLLQTCLGLLLALAVVESGAADRVASPDGTKRLCRRRQTRQCLHSVCRRCGRGQENLHI